MGSPRRAGTPGSAVQCHRVHTGPRPPTPNTHTKMVAQSRGVRHDAFWGGGGANPNGTDQFKALVQGSRSANQTSTECCLEVIAAIDCFLGCLGSAHPPPPVTGEGEGVKGLPSCISSPCTTAYPSLIPSTPPSGPSPPPSLAGLCCRCTGVLSSLLAVHASFLRSTLSTGIGSYHGPRLHRERELKPLCRW